ncbi:unnamed protein product [Spirodela intermedia]|uniref:Uncharacterized protein n=1 Tax=Spirodela intermedia TaxID=51605 RepID=A0A7I8K301_SPIIN|nr:unnamed protein product [Spirodela intermedia]
MIYDGEVGIAAAIASLRRLSPSSPSQLPISLLVCFLNKAGSSAALSHRILVGLLLSRAEDLSLSSRAQRKVVVVGSGWADLASAHHLTKQWLRLCLGCFRGFDVTVPDAGSCPAEEQHFFSFVEELGSQPHTKWAKSEHYSPEGKNFALPVFQGLPQLPAPFSALLYPRFPHLPLVNRLSAVPLIGPGGFLKSLAAPGVFGPTVLLGLSAPAEQCSAPATLGMLYYCVFVQDVNLMNSREYENHGCISGVVCGEDAHEFDAIVLVADIHKLHSIKGGIPNAMKLSSRDAVSVKIWMDGKWPFEDLTAAWTFLDLNVIFDEYLDESSTVLKADFMSRLDEKIVKNLSNCFKDLEEAKKFLDIQLYLFVAGDSMMTRTIDPAHKTKLSVEGTRSCADRFLDHLREGSFAVDEGGVGRKSLILQIPDPWERQMTRHDSTTSMEKTAPDMAPIPAPQKKPLSVARPMMAPVMAPMKEPTAARHGRTQRTTFVSGVPQSSVK